MAEEDSLYVLIICFFCGRYDKTKKVVDFLHPDELRAALPLSIGRQGCSDEELQEIRSAVMFIFVCLCVGTCEYFMIFSEAVVKYSVKTCHPHFYNQVQESRTLSMGGQFLETFLSATQLSSNTLFCTPLSALPRC